MVQAVSAVGAGTGVVRVAYQIALPSLSRCREGAGVAVSRRGDTYACASSSFNNEFRFATTPLLRNGDGAPVYHTQIQQQQESVPINENANNDHEHDGDEGCGVDLTMVLPRHERKAAQRRRSFRRRQGFITKAQRRTLRELWPVHGLEMDFSRRYAYNLRTDGGFPLFTLTWSMVFACSVHGKPGRIMRM